MVGKKKTFFKGALLALTVILLVSLTIPFEASAESNSNTSTKINTDATNLQDDSVNSPAGLNSNDSTEAKFDLNSNETQVQNVTLPDGKQGTFVVEPEEQATNPKTSVVRASSVKATSGVHKVSFYSGPVNASFKVKIANYKITKAYDKWYLIIGSSVKSSKLKIDNSKQATLYFTFGTPIWDFGGWNGWLRAKIKGKTLYTSIK